MGEWIIIPDDIVREIEKKCFETLEQTATPERVLEVLSEFVKSKLESKDPDLFDDFKVRITTISSDTIKRALNGRPDAGVWLEKNASLLDLLCWYGFNKNWKATLEELNISEDEIQIRKTGKNLEAIEKLDDTNLDTDVNEIKNENENTNFKYFRLLNNKFWKKYIVVDEDEKVKKLSRFFTHTDSSLVLQAVTSGEIVEFTNLFTVKDFDGNIDEKTSAQILDLARSQSFSLIKIVMEGGAGKTTLLFWLAYTYHDIYHFVFIDFLDENSNEEIFKNLKSILDADPKPVVILIDNATDANVARQLLKLIGGLKRLDLIPEVIFVMSERASRYAAKFEDDEIEQLFSGNIQVIDQMPIDKPFVFEKVYSWLAKTNPQIDDEDIKARGRDIFLSKSIQSVSESTYLLIISLKLANKIVYDFDWDDWDNFIKNSSEFKDLKYLFIIIACFYQFGIKLSLGFKSSYLGTANRLLILKAIQSMGLEKSPIVLKDENKYLALKHEHIATWFLRDEGNAILTQGFFRDFIKEIDNVISAKLLRKIRKASKLTEFIQSCIANELNPDVYLEIINRYLTSPSLSSDERVKMLTEKGITLLNLAREPEAIKTFEEIIIIDQSNNHARDQLAKIYLKLPTTYQLALNKYLEIYNNDGLYALIEINKLLKACRINNISLELNSNIVLSEETKIDLAKKYISKGEFDFASDILEKIDSPNYEVAKGFNLLANMIKFSNETIEKKRKYYINSIEINNECDQETHNHQFEIEYIVFLYRIREFAKSSIEFKRFCTRLNEEETTQAKEIYTSKIRTLTKLFFKDLPRWEETDKFENYLSKQCKNAAALINFKQTNIENIIMGYLILQTVKLHSRNILPEIYFGTLVQLAYCYMMHADKKWNNLSLRENRIVAEKCFDFVIYERGYLNQRDSMDMIKNLLSFKETKKSVKALKICEIILEEKSNKYVPTFYRYRANAKWHLKLYREAMHDYMTAIYHSKTYRYQEPKDFYNDMAYTYNNMALVICDCIENKISIPDFTLEKALQYCDKIEDYRKDFKPLLMTRKKIEDLNGNL